MTTVKVIKLHKTEDATGNSPGADEEITLPIPSGARTTPPIARAAIADDDVFSHSIRCSRPVMGPVTWAITSYLLTPVHGPHPAAAAQHP